MRSREVALVRYRGEETTEASDRVVEEEPLEIQVSGVPVAVVMRTPGHDEELATGFLLTERVIEREHAVVAGVLQAAHRARLDVDGVVQEERREIEVTRVVDDDFDETVVAGIGPGQRRHVNGHGAVGAVDEVVPLRVVSTLGVRDSAHSHSCRSK